MASVGDLRFPLDEVYAMHPPLTYELRVVFDDKPAAAIRTKQRLIEWLLLSGVESFVEGTLDVDFNQDQDAPPRDFYTELGGDLTPVSIYRYSRESLDDLRAKLSAAFRLNRITTELHTMKTETWMEGWKESFKPFATDYFYVRPPWREVERPDLIDLVIEPGMAFGTGQHATTRLCLGEIGKDAAEHQRTLSARRVLDVGTGTGILAIGAKKLGYGTCFGTDIEDDAILAAVRNAHDNHVDVAFHKGSLPPAYGPSDLVIANILAVVILRLMPDLARALTSGGRLLLSGLLVEEQDEIIASGREAGLEYLRASHQDGWACVVMAKP